MSFLEIEAIQTKLKDMVLKRYGCEIEWLPTGDFQLSGDEKLSANDRLRLNQLVQLVFEATEKTREQLVLLSKIEDTLGRIHPESEDQANILSLDEARRKRLESSPSRPLYVHKTGRNFRAPCLIESLLFRDIHKLALEIHDNSNSIAFLQVHDVNFDFNNLHRVTLFVPDICALNADQQQKLLAFMKRRDVKEGPHIIAGTTLPYSELKLLDQLDKDFLHKLSAIYIRMTKPFEEYRRLDVLPYIFDSLVF